MAGLNRVQLIGRLGKDPETRFTPTGKKVCSFGLAVNWRWRGAEGETKEVTDWFRVDAWGRLGEICQQYLKKGHLVFVEGRLRTDRYEHEGATRYSTRVVASQMQMLDRPEKEELEVRRIDGRALAEQARGQVGLQRLPQREAPQRAQQRDPEPPALQQRQRGSRAGGQTLSWRPKRRAGCRNCSFRC